MWAAINSKLGIASSVGVTLDFATRKFETGNDNILLHKLLICLHLKKYAIISPVVLHLLAFLGMVIFESSSEQNHFCHDLETSSENFSSQQSFLKQFSLKNNFPITMTGAVMPRTSDAAERSYNLPLR